MIKFMVGVVVGILLATYGASGVVRLIDNGVSTVVTASKNLAK